MTRTRNYRIWAVDHAGNQIQRGFISSLAADFKDPDGAAKFVLGGKWWVDMQQVAEKYKFIYCENLTGMKRSKLYNPEDFIREQRRPHFPGSVDPFR